MKNNAALALQFANECTVFELKNEYTDYAGYEQFGIITALTNKQLTEKYGTLLDIYKPYIVLGLDFGEIRNQFIRNEWKHEKRLKRGLSYGIDDSLEVHHEECAVPDCVDKVISNEESQNLWSAIKKLPLIQQQRVIKHFFDGKSSRTIAKEEGVYYSAVDKSLRAAIKNLKELLA